MGNKQDKQRGQREADKSTKSNEQNPTNQVAPFREGGNLVESKLKEFLRGQAGDGTNEEEENAQRGLDKLKQFKEDQLRVENIQKEILKLEEDFSREKLQRIREDFEAYSKENKMSRKRLLEYFGMSELDGKRLGNRLFQCVKSTFSQRKTGYFFVLLNNKALSWIMLSSSRLSRCCPSRTKRVGRGSYTQCLI